jgi:hypothetical protein
MLLLLFKKNYVVFSKIRFIFLPSADRQLGPLLLAHNKSNVTCVKCRPKVVLLSSFLSFFFAVEEWVENASSVVFMGCEYTRVIENALDLKKNQVFFLV